MRKRRHQRQEKCNRKLISEPIPITVNVDFQQMFSFPLSINNCTVKDLQNNNIKNLNGTLEFFKLFPRRKSLPVRRKKEPDNGVLERQLDLNLPKRDFDTRKFLSIPNTPTDDLVCSASNIPDNIPRPFVRQVSVPAIPSKPPRLCSEKLFICNRCGEKEKLRGKIELDLKSCAYCFTHYCSAHCQVKSLNSHIEVCYYGKIYKKLEILKNILCSKSELNDEYYKISTKGYKSKGRGCLFLTCGSPCYLFKLVDENVCIKPSYSTSDMLQKNTSKTKYQKAIIEKITTYDIKKEFLINITVIVENEIPLEPLPRMRDKCIRILFSVPVFDEHAEIDQPCFDRKSRRKRPKTL